MPVDLGRLARGRGGREEARIEAQRLLLGRDPVGEVGEPIGGEREVLGAQHVEERGVGRLAVGAIAREALVTGPVEAHRAPRGVVGEEHADLLEGLADRADPVAQRGARLEPAQPRRRGRGGEAHTEALGIGRHVVRLDLAAGEDVVPRRELALGVALDQQGLEAAGGPITEQNQGRGRGRDGGLGHGGADGGRARHSATVTGRFGRCLS